VAAEGDWAKKAEASAGPLAGAKKKLSKGDAFGAYDEASRAIKTGDESEEIRQVQLLALARMGDSKRALELFRSYGLDKAADPHRSALGARLLKDRALQTQSERALKAAYKAYRDIFAQTEDPYPGINAASMALLAGDADEARWIATNILVHPTIEAPEDYYCAATKAKRRNRSARP
jgi:adenylate cyclase